MAKISVLILIRILLEDRIVLSYAAIGNGARLSMQGCYESTCLAFRKQTLHFVADFQEEWRDELHL